MSDYVRINYKTQIHHLRLWAKGSSSKKYARVKAIKVKGIKRAKPEVLENPKQKFVTAEAPGFLKSIFIMIQE